nr:hypothetical protein Iba_chr02dCG0940 [Ipomoea batatas]
MAHEEAVQVEEVVVVPEVSSRPEKPLSANALCSGVGIKDAARERKRFWRRDGAKILKKRKHTRKHKPQLY